MNVESFQVRRMNMFIVLTGIALVSILYCIDTPIINENFSFLINNHDSILYGVGLSIIAAYIFFIFQVAIPEKIRVKRDMKLVYPKLQDIQSKMELIIKVIYPSFTIDKIISKSDILKELQGVNIFKDGARLYYRNKEATKIEALYKNCEYIHIKILEVLLYRVLTIILKAQ